jgi:Protein of unknown function (DUF2726)
MNSFSGLWPVIVAVVVGAVLLRLLAGRGKGPARVCGYRRREALLNPAEVSFFGVLRQAVGDEYVVFAKVRIADVLDPDRRQEKPQWREAFDRVSAKHFDFVLCDPASTAIHAVIELHERGEREERDRFLRAACESAGVRLIEIEAGPSYSVAQVRELIPVPTSPATLEGQL